MDYLNTFCISSGKKISPQKSNIAFFAGVDETLSLRISALSKISITTKMGKYLGTPFIMGMMKVETFHHILECIHERLEG